MASSSRFAEGMKKVIFSDVNQDDFPPLRSDSRASPGAASTSTGGVPSLSPHAGTRVSSESFRSQSGVASSPHGRDPSLHGVSATGTLPTEVPGSKNGAPAASVPCESSSSGGIFSRAASSWSSLFSSEVKLQFIAPKLIDGKKSVTFFKSVLDKGVSLWGDYLVGQFFGIFP